MLQKRDRTVTKIMGKFGPPLDQANYTPIERSGQGFPKNVILLNLII